MMRCFVTIKKKFFLILLTLCLVFPLSPARAAEGTAVSTENTTISTESNSDFKNSSSSSESNTNSSENSSSPGSNSNSSKNSSSSESDSDSSENSSSSDGNSNFSETEDLISSGSTVFKIDNKHIYSGMTASWQNGYTPTISNGKTSIILPVTASCSLKNNQLTADLNLGESANSPFVYKNYQKTVSLSSQKAKASNGKETNQTLYYIRFDLPLSDSRINGVYPVVISVTGEDAAGNEVNGSFTVHVTIQDGKSTESSEALEESASEPETKPSSQPIILISGHTCKPETPKAGEEFQVTAHLTNTSKTKSIQNMVVTISCDSPELTLLNDTSTIYIDKLKKGASIDLPLKYKASKNTTNGQYTIYLSMSYDNENAETLSSSGSIIIPIRQPLSVQMNMSTVAASVTAGDTISLNFQFLNLSRSTAYNVRCEVSGDGLLPVNTAFAGNLESGTSGEASMNIFIGSKQQTGSATANTSESDKDSTSEAADSTTSSASDSADTAASFYGPTTGTVTLYYEDADGNEYTETTTFYTNIQQPLILSSDDSSAEAEKAAVQKKAAQWWIALFAGGSIFVAAGIIFVMRKRKTAAERILRETFDENK